MKSVIIKAVALTMGLALVGCGKTESEKPGAGTTAPAASGAVASGAVAVPDDGKKFDPPIKPEQLPSGAWYCDMGTVHYARMHEGDKKCPLCQMKLKQKP